MNRLFSVCLFLFSVLLVTACSPAENSAVQPLPTVFPSPTPPEMSLDNAQRVGVAFLDAWQRGDFDTMYGEIAFASQEATRIEQFRTLYEATHETMTLESLTYQPITFAQDTVNRRLALLNYNVTFKTRLLGEFSDNNRNLRILFDTTTYQWKVAWSPGDIFAEMENGGQLRREMTAVNRGNIYDRNGLSLADQENPIVTVNIIERDIPQIDVCLNILTQALDTPIERLQARLDIFAEDWVNDIGTIEPQAYIDWQTQLETDCKATFTKRPARHYPYGNLMPHILGNVGVPEDEAQIAELEAFGFNQASIIGKSGIEYSWDETLRGVPGGILHIETPGIRERRVIVTSPARSAESVWLSVDANLQRFIVDTLAKAYSDNAEGWAKESPGASAIVMDVNTGEILAMVSWPTYDANAFTPFPSIGRKNAQEIVEKVQENPRNPLLNRAAQGIYPNGSTMKIATALAVADSGVFGLDYRQMCGGAWTREGVTKTDWLASGHGTVTFESAIAQSCNPFYYEAGYQMNLIDPELLPDYLFRFGYGELTGIGDIAESAGYVSTPEQKRIRYGVPWSFVDASLLAIGQEAEVTPLQVIRLTAAVANGGTLYRPYLVTKSGLFENFSYVAQPEVVRTIDIKPEVLESVRNGMCDVTTEFYGTAMFIFENSPDLQSIGVCGKTGTAQNLVKGTTHAWFTAYAPRERPQIAVIVMVEDAGEGSEVAAPIARDILDYYFFDAQQTVMP